MRRIDVNKVLDATRAPLAYEYILALFHAAGGVFPSRPAVHEAAHRLQLLLDEPVFGEFIQYPRHVWSPLVADVLRQMELDGIIRRTDSKLKLTEKGQLRAYEAMHLFFKDVKEVFYQAVGRK